MSSSKGEKVVYQVTARMSSVNGFVPDSKCELALSPLNFYAFESIQGQENIYHLIIPIKKIDFFGKYGETIQSNYNPTKPGHYLLAAIPLAFAGIALLPYKAKNARTEALKIIFRDETNCQRIIFFTDIEGNINKIIKKYNMLKSKL